MFSYSMLFFRMHFCLKMPIEKHNLERVDKGNLPAPEQPSMRKQTARSCNKLMLNLYKLQFLVELKAFQP